MMDKNRVSLYNRLPEIYRLRDEEQLPSGQLKSYLALVEDVFSEISRNIERLYHDFFIETCDPWVIPYIGDLLGVSHLSGDDWTLRADVADTIALRRRKGSMAALERLAFNLTGWGVHCVELRENLVWSQHLNHQRPDMGGTPPNGTGNGNSFSPIRGGTVTLRDPAMLSLLNTPFDPFAHIADLRPPNGKNVRYNLPNLGVFLWRLKDYRVRFTKPLVQQPEVVEGAEESCVARFYFDPLGRPVSLYNTFVFEPDREPPLVTEMDRTPGLIQTARLTEKSSAGRPECYLAVTCYDSVEGPLATSTIAEVGLQLHLPVSHFSGREWPQREDIAAWTVRGGNLCGWESGLYPKICEREIVIDPKIGRIMFYVDSPEERIALENHLRVSFTYALAGPVGAHPVDRRALPDGYDTIITVGRSADSPTLAEAIGQALRRSGSTVVEISDSLTHMLEFEEDGVQIIAEGEGLSLSVLHPLLIRAADRERPIICLRQPLRFRSRNPANSGAATVRLEGLYLTRNTAVVPDDMVLIGRAALNRLEIINCTLDPGGHLILDGSAEIVRAPVQTSMSLFEPYGFTDTAEENSFDQTPEIVLQRTISGPLLIDRGYSLVLSDTVIDAGSSEATRYAVAADIGEGEEASDCWGPPTELSNVTILGGMRVEKIHGRGGIWTGPLEVLNNQVGCLKYSCFSGRGDRLPQNYGCVEMPDAPLHFVSEIFGEPGYCQLSLCSDFRIRERGPGDDAMGAFGFLKEAHKWSNLHIRLREFMPLGVRPLLIPVS